MNILSSKKKKSAPGIIYYILSCPSRRFTLLKTRRYNYCYQSCMYIYVISILCLFIISCVCVYVILLYTYLCIHGKSTTFIGPRHPFFTAHTVQNIHIYIHKMYLYMCVYIYILYERYELLLTLYKMCTYGKKRTKKPDRIDDCCRENNDRVLYIIL